MENIFCAWDEFKTGKEKKKDVQEFALNLEDNLFDLHSRLKNGVYQHSKYKSFCICDPKLRQIHKAEVADRVLHHAIVKVIEPIFERSFIFDSYSSRLGKGLHKALERFRRFAWKLSQNNTKAVWILKCDVRKFFDSVNHKILLNLLRKKISDEKTIKLLEKIIYSFGLGKGIPLGNLTSQLFSNIYLDLLDQFVKRDLGIKNYIRYADDFLILSRDCASLREIVKVLDKFIREKLALRLHPKKVIIKRWSTGIDFLGYVNFPYYAVLRTKTKRRLLKKVCEKNLPSYLGLLSHCRSREISMLVSKKLCTGPHVSHLGEIGKFRVIKEQSSSAGVRRIRATVE